MIQEINHFKKLNKYKELRRSLIAVTLGLVLIVVSLGTQIAWAANEGAYEVDNDNAYEVWVIDQSDTTADGGGTMYIYQSDTLAGQDAATAAPEVIDLGGAARNLCLAQTGTAPRRPHMLEFNAEQSHAIISFVSTGHVLFMDTAARTPLS